MPLQIGTVPASLLALALGLAGCVTTTAPRGADRSPISLESRFHEVAFHDEETGREWPLTRWDGPLTVAIEGGSESDHQKIATMLSQIAAATGLQTSVVPIWAPAGARVRFLGAEEWQEFVAGLYAWRQSNGISNAGFEPQCYVNRHDLDGGKVAVVIRIPEERTGAMRNRCIAQELAHVTGLTFDTDGRADTVFGDWAGADHLTDTDRQLLRILYDPRLKSGMMWSEAQPIVQQIIQDLQ